MPANDCIDAIASICNITIRILFALLNALIMLKRYVNYPSTGVGC